MAGRGGEMSEENEINSYDMLAYYAKLMREDYVPKKALREWCEFEINNPAFTDVSILTRILDRFCKEAE